MILSICLPTYNRPLKAIVQLNKIIDQVSNIPSSEYEILVSDNNSTCEGSNDLLAHIESLENDRIISWKNQLNVGLIGNLKVLAERSSGEYAWFIGDDDDLAENAIPIVYNKIKTANQVGMYFLNHTASTKERGIVLERAFIPAEHQNLWDVLDYSGTTMMFITACVYRTDLISEIFKNQDDRLSLPFYASQWVAYFHGIYFVEDILIDNFWGRDASWWDQGARVMSVMVPNDIIRMMKLVDRDLKVRVFKSLIKYILRRKKSFAVYFLRGLGLVRK